MSNISSSTAREYNSSLYSNVILSQINSKPLFFPSIFIHNCLNLRIGWFLDVICENWGKWAACSAPCTNAGETYRYRHCEREGNAPYIDEERKTCQEIFCVQKQIYSTTLYERPSIVEGYGNPTAVTPTTNNSIYKKGSEHLSIGCF